MNINAIKADALLEMYKSDFPRTNNVVDKLTDGKKPQEIASFSRK